MFDESANRATSCLHGLAAVGLIWVLMFAASLAAAQDPEPRPWDRQSASALFAYIENIDGHGLDAEDYGPAELLQAIESGDPKAIESRATRSFGLVALDLASGHIRPGDRGRNYILSDTLSPNKVAILIDLAIASGNPASVLERLAPDNAQYASLRAALAALPADKVRERRQIEVNLERLRWMPRALGDRHLMVNIPEYRLRLMADGREVRSHRVIVGKRQTATPQFSAEVKAVILNPSWNVPQSIIAESVGRLVRSTPEVARARGYTWRFDNAARLQVTQQPGPNNALGQMKLEMTNPFSIYVHDTPNKNLFERAERTLSHGCIRTQDPFGLAETLLADAGWTRAMIDEGVAARQTKRVPLAAPIPIHMVYLTAVAAADGSVEYLDDPYSLDAAIAAKLQ
jgi:murein L,D-transpeptidase YcbB/YkuD